MIEERDSVMKEIYKDMLKRNKERWFVEHIKEHLLELEIEGKVCCKICDKDIDTIASERLEVINNSIKKEMGKFKGR